MNVAPAQYSQALAFIVKEGQRFLFAVNTEYFPLVFARGGDGKFHLGLNLSCAHSIRSNRRPVS